MQSIISKSEMVKICQSLRIQGKRIGFIPTMGYLHQGHLSLVEKARKENDVVMVSIFVNPTQFGPHEDYAKYPQDLDHDMTLLEGKADYVFCPSEEEIYLPFEHFSFNINDLADCLCGKSRPHHFRGVVLVLSKFFHIIQPNNAYFGQKDYQQYVIVKKLVEGLFFPINIFLCPTVREESGLAMSSRNVYLNEEERKQALCLYKSLLMVQEKFQSGEKVSDTLCKEMECFLQKNPLVRIDYVDIRDAHTLGKIETIDRPAVAALAAYFGTTRLIDNILLNL